MLQVKKGVRSNGKKSAGKNTGKTHDGRRSNTRKKKSGHTGLTG